MSAQPLSVRQLEALLRRVFRGLDADLDLARVRDAATQEAAVRGRRRSARRAALLALAASSLLLLLVVLEWSRHPGA